MAKRKSRKTAAELAQDEAETAQRLAEVARLRGTGAQVLCDTKGRIIHADRADVFELLRQRGSISPEQCDAVRRLERDMATAAGCDHEGGRPEGSRTSTEGAPGQNVSQRMVDASVLVDRAMKRIGPVSAKILERLLEPQFRGGALTRWRDAVQAVTKETNDRAQLALVRTAAENLLQVYRALDYEARPDATTYLGQMNARARA